MPLVLVTGAIGLLAGRFLPPLRYRHLGIPRFRLLPLLAVGVAMVIGAEAGTGTAPTALAVGGRVALLAAALANLHWTGFGVICIGLAVNLVPMVLNGGMPVRPEALVEAKAAEHTGLATLELRGPRQLEDGDDLLPALGDALPIRPIRRVVSFGDLIVAAGVGDAVAHATRRRRHSHAGEEYKPGPRLGDGAEPFTGVGMPPLGEA
ncbi:MAG: DUF5317 family protein [Acidimicrobiales bacterium]